MAASPAPVASSPATASWPRRRPGCPRREGGAEGPDRVPHHRQGHAPARFTGQGQPHGHLRHRRQAAGHGLCLVGAVRCHRRHGQVFRCGQGQGHARRDRRDADLRRRVRGGQQLLAGGPGPPGAEHRLGRRPGRGAEHGGHARRHPCRAGQRAGRHCAAATRGRACSGHCRLGQGAARRRHHPEPGPCADGADELHRSCRWRAGALDRRQAVARRGAGRGGRDPGRDAGRCVDRIDLSERRLWLPHRHRLHHPGRADQPGGQAPGQAGRLRGVAPMEGYDTCMAEVAEKRHRRAGHRADRPGGGQRGVRRRRQATAAHAVHGAERGQRQRQRLGLGLGLGLGRCLWARWPLGNTAGSGCSCAERYAG